MIKKLLKKIFNIFGLAIYRYKKSNIYTDLENFIPFGDEKNSDKENLLYYEGLKKSQNIQSDNFSKRLRYYSLQQIISYILNKNEVSDFVECGCWKGHSSFIISKLITSSKKKINLHIFASFEGLSVSTKNDQGFHLRDQSEKDRVAKYFSSSEEFLKKEVLNEFDFVKVYKGWIPERFNEIEEKKFSLIHLDVDLYEPTYESLKFFFPRLKNGGVIICDDYNFIAFPGAKKAWDDYFKDKNYSQFYKVPFGACFLIK